MEVGQYILKDRKIYAASYLEWAEWFQDIKNRQVANTRLPGNTRVSTVFLGLPPVYFETMVFGGALNERQQRYWTYKEAKVGHSQMVKIIRFRHRLIKCKPQLPAPSPVTS